ncbi:MAG: acyl-CoA dehydrogenase, partial [Deltaproteobacteria bacterium CG_4_9_14_3_um_filter_44_9]
DPGRVTVGAQGVGIAQGALDYAVDYAKRRVQFNQPIAEFQGIQFMVADMATAVEASRQLVFRAAYAIDEKEKDRSRLAAMSKYFASDTCMKVTTDAVQILGGYGYMKDYPLERMMREAKFLQIYEGTNQIQRIVVARSLLS